MMSHILIQRHLTDEDKEKIIDCLKHDFPLRPMQTNDFNTLKAFDCVEVPSAPRKGKWIYLNGLDAYECSVCGRQMVRNIFDYCPWCGAKMEEQE